MVRRANPREGTVRLNVIVNWLEEFQESSLI
jgi:hypothetical protein